ncbi:MAG TPA: DNA-3-methyladenine glycosylase [Actinomycetota bacterium]|nr:DNA-3-methyladenine glycosylase [Actinomycetota bacterium]
MPRLPRAFFRRSSLEVAPALLGHVLARRDPDDGSVLRVRIVETEAYDEGDPASHSFRGPRPRTAVMFGPPGFLYVYFTYGMHHCMNVVTDAPGRGSAVLLRAAEPVDGVSSMRQRRPGARNDRQLLAGPGRLTQALAIDRTLDGADLVRGAQVWIERGIPVPPGDVGVTERIGLSVAREQPWRFVDTTSAHLSRTFVPVIRRGLARR